MTLSRRVTRQFERVVLGMVMSAIAFIIERRILKAIRGTGQQPLQPARKVEFAPRGNGRGQRTQP